MSCHEHLCHAASAALHEAHSAVRLYIPATREGCYLPGGPDFCTHTRSIAQVALRWLVQRGVIIIPKSTHADRMAENLDILGFELTPHEMQRIAALDTGKSLFFDHHDAETTKMFMGWR